jgi:hypothetical protein
MNFVHIGRQIKLTFERMRILTHYVQLCFVFQPSVEQLYSRGRAVPVVVITRTSNNIGPQQSKKKWDEWSISGIQCGHV